MQPKPSSFLSGFWLATGLTVCVLLASLAAQAKSWGVSVSGYNYNALPIDQFKVESADGTAYGSNMPGLAYNGGEYANSTCCYRIGGDTLKVSYMLWTVPPHWKDGDPLPPFITRTIPFPKASDPKARILEVYFLPDGSVDSRLVSVRDRGPIPYSRIMERLHKESLDFVMDYPDIAGRDLFSERLSHAMIQGWLLGLRSEQDLYDFSMRAINFNVNFADDPSIAPGLKARKGNPRAIMDYLAHHVPAATWQRLAAEQKHYDETVTRAQDEQAKRRSAECKNIFEPCKYDE
ncbi:hypothetical protein LMG28688_05714 [Paraburkholderia caffeinitolerans]|uniref:DUF3304 domain-containing protein n=1 Tax=Paraburkholderia caffeinitolerans TaxID=1723730 RepID=A0A6J5GPV0_9BURK|nr:hypothetical protein LMG28688_05714 [Paraburkholderia caffeinitolerans]